MFCLLLIPIWLWADEVCVLQNRTCLDSGGTRNFDGFAITRECFTYQNEYECIGEEPVDYCESLSQSEGCEYISSFCNESNAEGNCVDQVSQFLCYSENSENPPVVTLINEEELVLGQGFDYSVCNQYFDNTNCQLKEKICLESGEKVIDGVTLARDCWREQIVFSCTDGYDDDKCLYYEQNCVLDQENCIANKGNSCDYFERIYNCPQNFNTNNVICGAQNYCLGDNCSPNTNQGDFLQAAAHLQTLEAASSDMSADGLSKSP